MNGICAYHLAGISSTFSPVFLLLLLLLLYFFPRVASSDLREKRSGENQSVFQFDFKLPISQSGWQFARTLQH